MIMTTDSGSARYKDNKIFFDRNLLYDTKNKLIPVFKDFELKIPFSIREHFYSNKRINLLLTPIELVNYI